MKKSVSFRQRHLFLKGGGGGGASGSKATKKSTSKSQSIGNLINAIAKKLGGDNPLTKEWVKHEFSKSPDAQKAWNIISKTKTSDELDQLKNDGILNNLNVSPFALNAMLSHKSEYKTKEKPMTDDEIRKSKERRQARFAERMDSDLRSGRREWGGDNL